MSEISCSTLETFGPDEPEPLFRPLAQAERCPIELFPPILRSGVEGIVARVQCPPELALNSVLGATSVVGQAFVDVTLHTGQVRPVSLNLVTVALSGERKTSADNDAMAPIYAHERALRERGVVASEQHRRNLVAWKTREKEILQRPNDPDRERKLEDLGAPPRAPFEPIIICDEPTFEGLTRQLAEGPGFAGVCSSEGGQFLGGYAMNSDNKLKSVAHFSKLWDGAPIRRTRGGDGLIVLAGRRATMHLMVQPGVGDSFLRDPLLRDQGFHSRVLLTGPPSRMGARFYREPTTEQKEAYAAYNARLAELLQLEPPRPDPARAELDPRVLELSPGARGRLIKYYDEVEAELSPTGALRDISGFANKLP